jgi:predicted HAD superfamily phosphohydrolase YqeG
MTPEQIAAQNDELLRAYNRTFGSPSSKAVMADLAAFCRASETTIVRGDQQASDVLAGRREVFLRIQVMSQLTEEEILQLRMERIRSTPQPTD